MKPKIVIRLFTLLLLLALTLSCRQGSNNSANNKSTLETNAIGVRIADTIIYDVIIRNPNPHDTWMEECLSSLDHDKLIDNIFEMIYSGEIIAYDYFDGKALKIREIKAIEKEPEFSREKIGKIQFGETWMFASDNTRLEKEIVSMVLGYELYSSEGEVRGYSPLFKVYLN